ncbi:MAG: hypothetical protein R6W82_11300 [bacterium]
MRVRRGGPPDIDGAAVVYWMQRAQRAEDNPALEATVVAANDTGRPLLVLLRLVDDVPGAGAAAARETLERFVDGTLAVNYVTHEPDYDRWEGLPDWGRETLAKHARDERPHLYPREELEAAATHDPLWNAGMLEMKKTGFMHGYVRMYGARKILHWSSEPEEALATAIFLNDRWFLDGRDPNGYANIAWAVGGLHDHPWPEREVFGNVRSMTYNSTSKKFDRASYIQQVERL